jgi:hypothetical protein
VSIHSSFSNFPTTHDTLEGTRIDENITSDKDVIGSFAELNTFLQALLKVSCSS